MTAVARENRRKPVTCFSCNAREKEEEEETEKDEKKGKTTQRLMWK